MTRRHGRRTGAWIVVAVLLLDVVGLALARVLRGRHRQERDRGAEAETP